MGLHADRRTLSESRVRENLKHGSMRGGWKHGLFARNGLYVGNPTRGASSRWCASPPLYSAIPEIGALERAIRVKPREARPPLADFEEIG